MYLVVFTAELAEPNHEYFALAEKLRQLAFDEYACLGFQAVNKGRTEIAISSWSSLEDIKRWKLDPVHQSAQRMASQWYIKWKVTITEVIREYET